MEGPTQKEIDLLKKLERFWKIITRTCKQNKGAVLMIIITIWILLFMYLLSYFYYNKESPAIYKCPEAYATDEEREIALNDYIDSEFDNFDNASDEELKKFVEKRYDFFIENNCVDTIRDNPTKEGYVNLIMRQSTVFTEEDLCNVSNCKTYNSELGFSFKYPDYLKVIYDKDYVERLYLIPVQIEDSDTITAVVISLGEAPQETPLEWMNGPNSGYDTSLGYEEIMVDGQNAISVGGGNWVVFNHPTRKYRVSIALLTDIESDALFQEEDLVVSSFKFTNF